MKARLDLVSMGCGLLLGTGLWMAESRWVKVSHALEPLPQMAEPVRPPDDMTLRQLQDEVSELQQHLHDVENAVIEVAPATRGVAVELLRGARAARRPPR